MTKKYFSALQEIPSTLSRGTTFTGDQLYIFPYDAELYYAWILQVKEELLVSSQVLPNRFFCDLLLGISKRSVKIKILLSDPSYFRLFSPEEIASRHNVHIDMVHYSKSKLSLGEKNLYTLNQDNIYPHFINNQKFFLNHSKYIVIDRKTGFVGSSIYGRGTKIDIGLATSQEEVINNLVRLFEEDYGGKDENPPQPHPDLLIAPTNMREKIKHFIKKAHRSIYILAPAITDDKEILQLLEEKIKGGVQLKVLCSPHIFEIGGATHKSILDHFYLLKLQKAGGRIKMTYQPLVHCKAIMIDEKALYLGSANLRESSLDKSREIGLFSRDKNALRKMIDFLNCNWESSVDYQ